MSDLVLGPAEILQFIFGGLTNGAIYALVALGLHIIFKATRVLNFVQGEQVVIGGLIALTLSTTLHVPIFLAFIAALIIGGAIGYAFERIAIRPAYRLGELATIMVTVGGFVVFKNGHQIIWGKESLPFPNFANEFPFSLLTPALQGFSEALMKTTGAGTNPFALWVMLLSILAVVAVHFFFQKTLFGKAMRAAADNPGASELMGIDTTQVTAMAFAMSAALAAAAGILGAPLLNAGGSYGIEIAVKGFSGAIVGGFSSSLGSVAGGFVVGIIEALGGGLISSSYKDVISFGIMLVVLLLRPSGLFGEKEVRRS
ncbi:MAG: branched-chain amino acid ABC transporter permease [Chloroflexi bacterium]|nr:branched-chain amino acid ABC transporter permease [Chloroflexota bacterium]